MAATKTKKRASKPAAKKSGSTRSSSSKKTAPVPVGEHGFEPGTKVGVYKPEEADFVRVDEREPFGKPETTATVTKEGDLNVSGLKKGSYVAVGKVADKGGRFGARFRHVAFVVK